MDPRTDQRGSVTERFRTLDPASFQGEIDRIWQGAERVKDVIVEQVTEGVLDPLTGLQMVACVTGQAFGYQQAHGQPTTVDLLTALQPELARR